jgi:HSP20 family protein
MSMRTLVNMNPSAELRAFEEMFDRMMGMNLRANPSPAAVTLPIDILEREGDLVVRAAIPGIDPKDLDVQVEENVLTIRGESRHESETKDEKVYRREISAGRFVRSIRLPEGLNLEGIDAEFRNGIVTIRLPRLKEERAKALKVTVRTAENESNATPTEG